MAKKKEAAAVVSVTKTLVPRTPKVVRPFAAADGPDRVNGKFVKRDKRRLPRREKKANQKKAAAKA